MKKTIAAVAVFALGASLAIAGENWQGGHRGHRGEAGFSQKMAEKLNLSDAQKAQIKSMEQSFRDQNKAFFESAKATREQFRAAKEANDTAKIEALRPTMESQRAQMKQLRDAQREKIRTILTPDQRTQLDAWKAQHDAKRQERQQQQ